MSDVSDAIRFLSQSGNRADVLKILGEEGQLDRYEIEEQVDASRRTVIRTLDALIEQGYVEEAGDAYRLTAFGSFLSESYQELAEDVGLAHRLSPFLSNVAEDVFDLDPCLLEDAELVVATEGSPYALLDRTLSLRRNAQQVQEIAPMIEQKSIDQLAQRIRNQDLSEFEVIISKAAVQAGKSNPEYQEAFQTIAESDRVSVFVYPEVMQLFLCIADETVAIGASKDDKPYALVVTTNPTVKQWAKETFAEHRTRATQPLAE